jgi:PleD family two-component response regulator
MSGVRALLKAADVALYAAKAEGRNCSKCAPVLGERHKIAAE